MCFKVEDRFFLSIESVFLRSIADVLDFNIALSALSSFGRLVASPPGLVVLGIRSREIGHRLRSGS